MMRSSLYLRGLSRASLLAFASTVLAQAAESGFPALSTVKEGGAPTAAESGAAATTYDGLTGAPTVTNANAAPTYPPATIPPTADAPFMQKSSYPTGTVFISAGALLGFMLACVLLWRAWVAWSIHRSMQRAKRGYVSLVPQQTRPPSGILDGGAQLLKKSNPFYKQHETSGSMITMSLLHNKEQHAASQEPLSSKAPDKRSLFFSPTAASGLPATGLGVKRGSEYLPSGYYAAGGGDRSQSQAYSIRDLPSARQEHAPHRRTDSTGAAPLIPEIGRDTSPGLAARLLSAQSTTSLGTGAGSRAPSAYLEDLFDARPASQSEHDGLR